MGKNSQQRRAAKQRRQADRDRSRQSRPSASWSSPPPTGPARDSFTGLGLDDLVRFGAQVSFGSRLDETRRDQVIAQLTVLAAKRGEAIDRVLTAAAINSLCPLWRNGWLPLDLLHAARRQLPVRTTRLVAELILDDGSLRAPDRPPQWGDQLDAVAQAANTRLVPSVSGVERWRRVEKYTIAEAASAAFEVIAFLATLPRLSAILPPPSDWARLASVPRSRSGDSGPGENSGMVDAKVLDKIRALLAKAEGTDFPAEAEAFTSKAQELMSRHAIDTAMLPVDRSRDLASGVRSRRVYINNPYAVEKAQLLGAVAKPNGGRVVWDEQFGWATVVGFPVDLDLIELLFTSLLIQLTRAMSDAGRSGGRTKSPSFRRAFALSYAVRIGERLVEARHHARDEAEVQYGSALVPVIAARTEAVDQVTEESFPNMRESRARRVDAHGWRAGRVAADIAAIQSGAGMIQP